MQLILRSDRRSVAYIPVPHVRRVVPPEERGDGLFARRPVSATEGSEEGYRRTLGPLTLTAIGIAGIIGAGIFVVLGVLARDVTGPAIVVSVVIAGVASVLSALVLAELAGMAPGSGGLYGYAYTSLGRLPAFLVGWSTLLAYMVGNMAVAVGWTSFFVSGLTSLGVSFPSAFSRGPALGGIVNLPAVLIVLVVMAICLPRVRGSTAINNALVVFKLLVILVFVGLGVFLIRPENWRPFAPNGMGGIMVGAASLIFAYLGFDTVSAAGAEARRPHRDLPLGTLASVGVAAVLYVAMGAVVTGIQPVATLTGDAPLVDAFRMRGFPWAAGLIVVGALVALTTVIYAFHLALSRVLQTMAYDGFLPSRWARLHPRTGTPWAITIITGLITAAGAGFFPLRTVADMTVVANIFLFVLVAIGVLILKRVAPDMPRSFRAHPVIPVLAVVVLIVILVTGIAWGLQLLFAAWLGLGMVIYGVYAGRRARY